MPAEHRKHTSYSTTKKYITWFKINFKKWFENTKTKNKKMKEKSICSWYNMAAYTKLCVGSRGQSFDSYKFFYQNWTGWSN